MDVASPPVGAVAAPRDGTPTDAAPVRALLVLAGLGAAAIHFGFAPAHFGLNSVHGAFFLGVAWLQLAWALAIAWRPTRVIYGAGVALNLGVLGVWLASRTIGIDGTTESLGFPDAAASALELIIVIGAFGAAGQLLPRRSFREATSGAMFGAAAVAITAVVSASMVPSLSGHGSSGSGADNHGGGATTGSEEAAASGGDHHGGGGGGAETATVSDESGTSSDQGEADDGHEPAVAVPYDPDLPIDLGGVDGVTPQQQAEAENVVATTLLGLPQWTDAADAEAAGFQTIGDGGTGIEHLINLEFMDDDVILDPDKPESLVYNTEGGGRRLVAAMYMTKRGTPLSEVPDLGGKLMQWHVHQNLCYNAEGRVAGITDADGNCPPGLVKPEETPMIHVWIEPHPCGPFAALEGIGAGAIAEGEERLCDAAHGG